MISFLKKNLNVKIIITLVIVLALSFSALSVVIVSVQNSLLGQMMEKVDNKLIRTENNAAEQFSALETNVGTALQKMGDEVTGKLSNSTAKALSNEEKRIRKEADPVVSAAVQGRERLCCHGPYELSDRMAQGTHHENRHGIRPVFERGAVIPSV